MSDSIFNNKYGKEVFQMKEKKTKESKNKDKESTSSCGCCSH